MNKRKKSTYHARAKYDALNPVILSPKLIDMYARMRKTEIILHLIIQSRTEDGKLKRNIRAIEYGTGIHHEGLVEAEGTLKRMKLLKIAREGSNTRIWSLPEQIGQTEEEQPVDQVFEPDKIDHAKDTADDLSTEKTSDAEIEEESETRSVMKWLRRIWK
jgi:hypothetical protein